MVPTSSRGKVWAISRKVVLMEAFDQMMELEYQTKYRKKITVGEALRLLRRLEEKRGTYFNKVV